MTNGNGGSQCPREMQSSLEQSKESVEENKSWLWKWTKRIVGGLVFLFVVSAFVGMIYQAVATSNGRRYQPPGKLVDIGGRRLHINCVGEGFPTVLLESGIGDYSLSWVLVQPEVARFTRVCSYDRAGLGWSDPGDAPRTSHQIVQDLGSLLRAAGIAGPYVLVGHSLGGYHVRVYACQHRTEIVGMVLVDSAHEDQGRRLPAAATKMQAVQAQVLKILPVVTLFGVPRLIGLCGDAGSNPPPQIKAVEPIMKARECRPDAMRAIAGEFAGWDASARQVAASGSLGNIPLIVLSHDPAKPMQGAPPDLDRQIQPVWMQMQQDLTHLSSNGSQIIAFGSGHYIQVDRPDLVIDAIHRVVEAARR